MPYCLTERDCYEISGKQSENYGVKTENGKTLYRMCIKDR